MAALTSDESFPIVEFLMTLPNPTAEEVAAVDQARQGEGLGRRMLEAAEDRFRRMGCEAVDITVLSLRPEFPPVYGRLGYVETGTEEFKSS